MQKKNKSLRWKRVLWQLILIKLLVFNYYFFIFLHPRTFYRKFNLKNERDNLVCLVKRFYLVKFLGSLNFFFIFHFFCSMNDWMIMIWWWKMRIQAQVILTPLKYLAIFIMLWSLHMLLCQLNIQRIAINHRPRQFLQVRLIILIEWRKKKLRAWK